MTGAVARRYARALLAVAQDRNRVEETAQEIARAAATLADPQLARALGSPMLPAETRAGLLDQVAGSMQLSPLAKDFLGVLLDRSRLAEIGSIARAYEEMADAAAGRVRATIHAAKPLDDSSAADLVAALEKIAGRKVIARVEIDPALVAGVTVEMEGRVYDGSVRTQLEHLARAMAREGRAG